MSEQQVIISFDIGIRNLSLCAIIANKESDTIKLLLWKNLSLLGDYEKKKNVNLNELSGRLFMELDIITDFINISGHEIDTILLENQPTNGIMKSIQLLIYSYYQLRRHWQGTVRNVHMISATQKLLNHHFELSNEFLDTIKNKRPYDIRKLKSIEYIRKYIENDPASIEIFNSNNKKDDLSDTLNQAISWLNKQKYNIRNISMI